MASEKKSRKMIVPTTDREIMLVSQNGEIELQSYAPSQLSLLQSAGPRICFVAFERVHPSDVINTAADFRWAELSSDVLYDVSGDVLFSPPTTAVVCRSYFHLQ